MIKLKTFEERCRTMITREEFIVLNNLESCNSKTPKLKYTKEQYYSIICSLQQKRIIGDSINSLDENISLKEVILMKKKRKKELLELFEKHKSIHYDKILCNTST